jgi:hypothetical protein
LIDAGALDQAIEQDHQGPLILVRELIDLLIEAVQFGVMNRGLVVGLRPPGQFVETSFVVRRNWNFVSRDFCSLIAVVA